MPEPSVVLRRLVADKATGYTNHTKPESRRVVLGNRRWNREVSMSWLKGLLLFAVTAFTTVLILAVLLTR